MTTGSKDMYQLADEFIISEQQYVDVLTILNHLEVRLKKHLEAEDDILMEDEIKNVFINSASIYNFNADLVKRLNKIRWEGPESFICQLPDILIKDIQFFKMYGNFIKDVRDAEKKYFEYYQKHKDFKRFMDLNEKIYNIPSGDFKSILTSPVQRFPKYIISFGAILSAMPTTHEAYQSMKDAVDLMQAVMDDISDKAEATMRSNRVLYIQSVTFKRNILIVDPSRKWYRTSRMKIKDLDESKKQLDCVLHLFNDCILYSTRGLLGGINLKGVMLIAGINITPVLSTPNTFKLTNPPLTKSEWELTCVDDDRDTADASYMKWLSALTKVYNLHYNIFDSSNRPANPTTTSNAKILHPEDLMATIRKKTVANPRYIDKPAVTTQDLATQEINRARGDGSSSSATVTISGSSAPMASTPTGMPPQPPMSPGATPPPKAAIPAVVPRMSEEEIWNAIVFPVDGWNKVWDDNHQQYYYENLSLQVTQWELPEAITAEFERLREKNEREVTESEQAAAAAASPPPSRPVFTSATPGSPAPPPTPAGGMGGSTSPQPPQPPSFPTSSSSVGQGGPPAFGGSAGGPPAFGASPQPPQPPSTAGGPPPTPGGPGGPGGLPDRGSLLSAISAGTTLKKVSSDDDSGSGSAPPRNPLLAGISGGVTLKKVDTSSPPSSSLPPQEDTGGLNIGAHLQASLANYRKYVQDDGSDDEYDDDEW